MSEVILEPSSPKEMVNKVTLSSGKVVLVRPMKIKQHNLAIKSVGKKAGDNNVLLASLVGQELLKMLVVQIDGKNVSGKDLEDLDEVFDFKEFNELNHVLQNLMGGEPGELKTETVSIGSR